MKLPINSYSPSEITKVLQDYVESLSSDNKWKDFYNSSTGRTIIELLAGVGSMNIFYEILRLKESSLIYAENESSITQLAINRGVFKKPGQPPVIQLDLSYNEDRVLAKGDIIGTFKDFNVYINDNYHIVPNTTTTVQAVIGEVEKFEVTKGDDKTFYVTELQINNRYNSSYLESLFINNDEAVIIDEQIPLFDTRLPNTVLRVSDDYSIKLISGNGVIGKSIDKGATITYQCLTFSDKLLDYNKELTPKNIYIINGNVYNMRILNKASGFIDKDSLRFSALRSSFDGRWVSKDHYESGIMLKFSNYVHDILVVDEYPTERIVILPNDLFTDQTKADIIDTIEKHKGNAVKYNLIILDDTNSFDFTCNLVYTGTDNVIPYVNKIIKQYSYKIYDADSTISESDVALALSKLCKTGEFYLLRSNNDVTKINKLTYLKNIIVNYSIK